MEFPKTPLGWLVFICTVIFFVSLAGCLIAAGFALWAG